MGASRRAKCEVCGVIREVHSKRELSPKCRDCHSVSVLGKPFEWGDDIALLALDAVNRLKKSHGVTV